MSSDQKRIEIDSREIEKQRASDPRNWLELYGDQLYRYTMTRVNDSAIAEEIVQETMLGAIQSRDSFSGKSTIRTWLFAILKNKLRDYLRKKQRGSSTNFSAVGADEEFNLAGLLKSDIDDEEFHSSLEREEFWVALESCVEKLPQNFGEAFRSRLNDDDATVEQLSKNLNITESNFNVRLFRARLMIRKCLEKLWLGSQ